MKMMKCIMVYLLTIAMMLPLMSCGSELPPQENPDKIQTEAIHCPAYNTEDAQEAAMDFSVRLFQISVGGPRDDVRGFPDNVLISPVSVLTALAMTANGAQNDTLAQMEAVFGVEREPLRDYLRTYLDNLPNERKYKLHMANSIWIKEDENFTVNEEFIDINKSCFGAGVYEKEFDQKTLKEINKWVDENTDGMIEEILNEIPEDAVMYLINALAFDAEWEEIYENTEIRNGEFTLANGSVQDVEYMYSDENVYLEDEKATGFIKYYKDRKYAFAAILPNENVGLTEYVAGMSGESLKEMLDNAQEVQVNASIPKFEVEDDILLNDTLKVMGMEDIFDGSKADLSGIGTHTEGNLFVSRVIHKTHMQVDEKGTKAGAATAVEVKLESAMETLDSKTVRLDRPFIYMIIDCESNQPIFMGTMQRVLPFGKCGVEDLCGYPTAN
ncbi:MAG: serpin family protein [Agathobacter sp.]|nr:serpin family protein [Agathobacter sp.]